MNTKAFCTAVVLAVAFSRSQPSPANADEDTVEILLLGDMSFGENYQERLEEKGEENVLKTRGYDYMIDEFGEILADADFAVVNLETPLTDAFPSPFEGVKNYLHHADPRATVDQLTAHGVDLVSLANNHALDFGLPGLDQTTAALGAAGVDYCGVGENAEAAGQPATASFKVGDRAITMAILCHFEHRDSYEDRYDYYATADRAGANPLVETAVREQMRQLRANAGPDLFVLAFPHWGSNYKWADDQQRGEADFLIDAGVDLIIGHGSHMVQEVEKRGGTWVAYSLGNFVFGSPGRYERYEAPPYSLIAMLRLSPGPDGIDKNLRLYPIFTDNRKTDYRSRFVTEAEFADLQGLLRERFSSTDRFDETFAAGTDRHGHYLEIGL